MSYLDNKLVIARSIPGGRDVIYIGYAKREDDLLFLSNASMIVRYVAVGVSGLADQPDQATRLRPVTGGKQVCLPMRSIADIIPVNEDVWKEHLGVSR